MMRQSWYPRFRLAVTILCAATLTLSACAAGPDFQPPAAPPATAVAAPASTATQATPVPGGGSQWFTPGMRIQADWYRLFQSPALDVLIAKALENNPSIEAAQAHLRQARHELEAADGVRYPSVDAQIGVTRERNNGAILGLGGPQLANVFNLYTAGLSLNYDLDLFGANQRGIEAQSARVESQHYALLGTYLTLIDNLVVTALNAADIEDRITATRHIITNEQAQLKLIAGLEQAGTVSHADVLRAEAQLATVKATLPPLRQALAVQHTQLAILSGIDPGEFAPPALSLKDFTLPRTLPYSVPSELVRQRPDILEAESDLHVASAEVGVATANLYPHLTLSASYGVQGNDRGTLFDAPSRVWSIGGSLLAPLFHGEALHAQRNAAVDAYDAAYAQYRATVLQAFGQVTNTLNAIDNDADALRSQHDALVAAQASRQLVEAQYRVGAANYLDVLTTEQQYDQTDIAYLAAFGERYVDTAELYQTLGGGWWNAKPKESIANVATTVSNSTRPAARLPQS
ncbi:MAG: efflux transporter outer membrane subunit [Gammaproteobacteria bacterium]